MIKKYIKKEIKEVKTTTEEMFCDFCGKKANRGEWGLGCYEEDKTEIRITITHIKGDNFPEGRYGTKTVVDLCPDCFENVLMPFIRSKSSHDDFDSDY